MKTEHKFALALKTLMQEKPLDDISVLLLCKKCKVNRQTFYYHFHDIYDLLTLVFLDEKIEGADKISNYKEMILAIYNYYNKNKLFIDATLNSAGKDLFQEFVYNFCYQSSIRIIENYEISRSVSPNNKKSVARFYASAFSNSIVYYFSNSKEVTQNGLLHSFNFINDLNLLKILQNLAKKPNK